jgi:AcrR family transcriptional regulator
MLNFTKRQNEIIDMSIGLIAEAGIQNLTIKNISEKMGISEPALYRHYKSKLDILLAILSYFEDSSRSMLEEITAEKTSNLDKLESIFVNKCSEFAKRPELAKVIFSEEIFQNEAVLSQKVVDIMKIHGEIISKIIGDAQKNGEIKNNIPVEHLTLISMGSLRLIVTKWRLSGFKFDIVGSAKSQWQSIKLLVMHQ